MNYIETMKMAMEWYDSGQENRDEFIGMIKSITAIEQGESEPVAEVVRREIEEGHGTPASHTFDVKWRINPFEFVGNLYAAPVADYVPLSDEQIDDITKKTWPHVFEMVMPAYLSAYRGYARAIERAVRGAS